MMIRPLFSLMLLTFFGQVLLAQEVALHSVSLVSSELIIHGKTNVNSFDCELKQASNAGSLQIKSTWYNSVIDFDGLKLKFRVADFDCGMAMMNNDLQELLKEEEFPYVVLEIKRITINAENRLFSEVAVYADVLISMAGENKVTQIKTCSVTNYSDSHLLLHGHHDLLLSSFKLYPEPKFFGTVVISDKLSIEFAIEMKVATQSVQKKGTP